MNIVLYFGSFNPIHKAHLAIADTVSSIEGVDKLWLVVSPHNPLKLRSVLVAESHRFNMASMAIGDMGLSDRVEVCDVEFTMPQPSYTYLTIKYLRDTYPQHRFSMVMGSDNLSQIKLWREYEYILNTTTIYLYPREGYKVEKDLFEKYDIIEMAGVELFELSSTDVRARKVADDRLAPSTLMYIQQNNLYK